MLSGLVFDQISLFHGLVKLIYKINSQSSVHMASTWQTHGRYSTSAIQEI